MKTSCSCTAGGRKSGRPVFTGLVSGGLFILLPKCPACLAAYAAAWAGIGLSFSEAAALWWLLYAGGLAGLAWAGCQLSYIRSSRRHAIS